MNKTEIPIFRPSSIDLPRYKRMHKRSESDDLKDKLDEKVSASVIRFLEDGRETAFCVIS